MTQSTTDLDLSRILGADAVWDLVLGVTLCVLPLFIEGPWPLFVALGVGCLAFSAVLWRAASQNRIAVAVCQAAALGNALAVLAALVALTFYPTAGLALAIVAVGCTVFATLEWRAFSHKKV
jgi:hypothetical protein